MAFYGKRAFETFDLAFRARGVVDTTWKQYVMHEQRVTVLEVNGTPYKIAVFPSPLNSRHMT